MDLPPMRPPTAPSSVPMPMYTQQPQQPQQQPMMGIDKPHNNDVLCGRGVTTNRHVGNENFRSLVNCNKELYVTSTKKQKMRISRSIVEAVRSLDPAGRFLEKDQSSGKWFDIGDKKAVEKTSQALRDGAAGLRKQLSEDLSDPDFLSAVFDMDVIPEKKAPPPKKEKKTPAKKGHRRTKSNPTVGTAKSKTVIKKQQQQRHSLIYPASPMGMRLPMIPKPPRSPMSPRSSPPSPRVVVHSSAHRRVQSQGGVPLPGVPTSPPYAAPYYHAHPLHTNSFEYSPDHSPRGYGPPRFASQPLSPTAHPMSPYGRSQHHFQPNLSPRWSPRHFAHPNGPTSPRPYMRPGDYPRRSPEQHPLAMSPRGSYSAGIVQPNNSLSVPTLGSERGPRPAHHPLSMAPPRFPPPSPRHHHHPTPKPLPAEFTPPSQDSRGPRSPTKGQSPMAVDKTSEPKPKKEQQTQENRPSGSEDQEMSSSATPAAKSDAKKDAKCSSPAAVADVSSNDVLAKDELMMSPLKKDSLWDMPFDEGPNPACDLDFSPLPLDREDPLTLMELPENILSLPISPCGPHDGEAC